MKAAYNTGQSERVGVFISMLNTHLSRQYSQVQVASNEIRETE
jgi:hypothetical protein